MNLDFRSALLPGRKSLAVGLTILASLFMINTAMSQGLGIDQYRELLPYRYLPRLPIGDENPTPLPRDEAPIACW